jgi:hypothetical protein
MRSAEINGQIVVQSAARKPNLPVRLHCSYDKNYDEHHHADRSHK